MFNRRVRRDEEASEDCMETHSSRAKWTDRTWRGDTLVQIVSIRQGETTHRNRRCVVLTLGENNLTQSGHTQEVLCQRDMRDRREGLGSKVRDTLTL
jgi:hypothetical protein